MIIRKEDICKNYQLMKYMREGEIIAKLNKLAARIAVQGIPVSFFESEEKKLSLQLV